MRVQYTAVLNLERTFSLVKQGRTSALNNHTDKKQKIKAAKIATLLHADPEQ